MTPVLPSSVSTISLIPRTDFTTRRNNCFTRCKLSGKTTKQTLSSQKYILPLSTSVRLFPQFRIGCALRSRSRTHVVLATGTEVAIEEPVVEKESDGGSDEESSVKSEVVAPPPQPKRSRQGRKSEMPPVKNEELVPGATFTGKVRSIQPFGAFVDFGAFTDGLVHVSQLSDGFVKDVGSIVSLGQEVKVRLLEANTETGRISLTMRENDDSGKGQQQNSDRPARKGPPRSNKNKNEVRKSTKFVKGQDLEGTVKNMTRSGAFISLPEGEEGFLPASEESDEGFANIMGGPSSLQVGQEVKVRVLRIARGQVTLTQKKEEDVGALDLKLSQGVVYEATNPFVLAFRENKDIAAFLDERVKEEEETSDEIEGKVKQTEIEVPDQTVDDDNEASSEELDVGPITVDDASTEVANLDKDPESALANSSESVDGIDENVEENVGSNEVAPEENVSTVNQLIDEGSATGEEGNNGESDLSVEKSDQILPLESVVSKEITESQADEAIKKDGVPIQTPSAEDEISSATAVEEEKIEANPEDNGSIISSTEDITEKENDVSEDVATVKDEVQIETPSTVDEKAEPLQEKNGSVAETNGQAGDSSPQETSPKAAISPALVKQLREETGAGMMDCKKALSETGGDLVKAQEFLRKKGLASADKKASRATSQGRIGSYIHDSRIGVLIEVNCETDFVSRGDIFKELVDDLAMQVAACPQVQYLVTDDVSKEIVDKEREIEMQKEDLLSKPEQIRSKIVEGRIRKRLEELALLEQPYIKNDKVVVKDFVKQTIATIGENIKVKRFVRYNLGEGLEKKSQDFAAEVAAQTAAKPVSAPAKEQPASVEAKETVDSAPTVAISAALVKQLREETGAGMMDCKKALSETGGDLEKAQEYLRKKGLSAADKKSSRLAAEGRIGSYIHDSRIGVLIEVNCETDFVGRSEKFKELVDDLAMQVAACPQVQCVSIDDIPESIVRKEKELEMQREDLLSKPENIRERIVEGRVSKRLGELVLLEQPFIKDDSVLVKDLVKQTVAALGENIKVRRFVRFTLGEETESEKAENEA